MSAAYDPNFADVYEKRNSARLNYGVGLCKYTGSRGKSGASDASAELVAYARRIFDGNGVIWQMAELARWTPAAAAPWRPIWPTGTLTPWTPGSPSWPCTPPFEVVSKLDCYMTYRAMMAVYEKLRIKKTGQGPALCAGPWFIVHMWEKSGQGLAWR